MARRSLREGIFCGLGWGWLWLKKGVVVFCGERKALGLIVGSSSCGREGSWGLAGVEAEIYTCEGMSPFYVNGQRSKAATT